MQSITPPLIAVIGSDGSGKSTVCEHLITVVEKYAAAERVHLGKVRISPRCEIIVL